MTTADAIAPSSARPAIDTASFVAVLLAAGAGARLEPLTRSLPKPLATVANVPIIDRLVDQLSDAGARRVLVNVHHLGNSIGAALDLRDCGVDIEWRQEPELTGPAGALHAFDDVLDGEDAILVQSGDAVHDIDLASFLQAHLASGAPLSVVVKRVPDPRAYGVARLAADGRVLAFAEKPAGAGVEPAWVSCGIYALGHELLRRVPRGEVFDFGRHLIPALVSEGVRVHAHRVDAYWNDVGSPTTLRQANLDAVSGIAGVRPPGRELAVGVWVEDGAVLHQTARVRGPVAIGRGATIGAGAQILGPSVIGADALVGDGARIEGSVVLSSAVVPPDTWLHGALVAATGTTGARS